MSAALNDENESGDRLRFEFIQITFILILARCAHREMIYGNNGDGDYEFLSGHFTGFTASF